MEYVAAIFIIEASDNVPSFRVEDGWPLGSGTPAPLAQTFITIRM